MHGSFYDTDETLGKAYDRRIMGRLLGYVRPYRRLLLFAAFFLLLNTALDLSLPYIVKTAIDHYIVPRFAPLQDPNAVPPSYRGPVLPLRGDTVLIELTRLSRGDRIALEAQGILLPHRYWAERKEALNPAAQKVIARHPDRFREVQGYIMISAEALRTLPVQEVQTLRGGDLLGVIRLGLLYLLILLFNFFFTFGHTYTVNYLGQLVMKDLRLQVLGHLLRLPVRFFDRNPVGRLVTRATNDIQAINEMFTNVVVYLMKDIILLMGILTIMFRMNPRLTLFILVLVPVLGTVTAVFRAKVRSAYREVRRKIAAINAFLQESISGIRIIHVFAQERTMEGRFRRINHELYEANIRQMLVFAVFRPLIELIGAIGIALIIWRGGLEVLAGGLTLGALVAFYNYTEMLFRPIRDLAEKYNILQSAMAAGERIFQVLDERPETPGGGRRLPRVEGRIEFRHVWFAYNDEEWVLKDLSFTVEPGQTVALVGHTGAGKTSVVSLLLRFYDIQKGEILLDGVDIRELDLDFLRAQFALVMQDVFIFSGDIRRNIRLFEEGIAEERVRRAAETVYAHTFIERLPGGYGAEVRERGATLSMGQRQLLAFARALAFDPKILILDEATANIDTETEALIQRALKKLLEGRTAIVIAHRLSTIRDADKILVLHKGRLVEEGAHEELLARGGFYSRLYRLQFGWATAPRPTGVRASGGPGEPPIPPAS